MFKIDYQAAFEFYRSAISSDKKSLILVLMLAY